MRCTGNKRQICGGRWANTVYQIGKVKKTKPRRIKYYGCWRDGRRRALRRFAYQSRHNSIRVCVRRCYKLGYKFAGLQYSKQCFCGNRFTRYGRARNCRMRCSGNRNRYCGGPWANSVFSTGRSRRLKKLAKADDKNKNVVLNSEVESSSVVTQKAAKAEKIPEEEKTGNITRVLKTKVEAQQFRRETSLKDAQLEL